ncbi:MAG: hypothetical protein QME12_04400 [Nanoarchaeota archaeon]|nr:hypothetical protein [Nanoarchaeota archaeon]
MIDAKLRFVCEACNYKFQRQKTWRERICPFCGKHGTVHEERSVADLLDDPELGTCVPL